MNDHAKSLLSLPSKEADQEGLHAKALDALEASWRVYAMIEAMIDGGVCEDGRPLSFDHVQRSRVFAWALTYRAAIAVEAARCCEPLHGNGMLARVDAAIGDTSSLCFVPSKKIRDEAWEVQYTLSEVSRLMRQGEKK